MHTKPVWRSQLRGRRKFLSNLPLWNPSFLSRIAFAVALAILGSATAAWCDDQPQVSIVYLGTSFNSILNEQEYDYGLEFASNSLTEFDFLDEITISGLSGVNGAQVSGALISDGFAGVETTPDSASMFLFIPSLSVDVEASVPPPGSVDGTLAVYSAVTTTSDASWSIQDFDGVTTGTVIGPVAPASGGGNPPGGPGNAVPEPGALELLLAGTLLVGCAFLARRRNRFSLMGPKLALQRRSATALFALIALCKRKRDSSISDSQNSSALFSSPQ